MGARSIGRDERKRTMRENVEAYRGRATGKMKAFTKVKKTPHWLDGNDKKQEKKSGEAPFGKEIFHSEGERKKRGEDQGRFTFYHLSKT